MGGGVDNPANHKPRHKQDRQPAEDNEGRCGYGGHPPAINLMIKS